MELWSGVAPVPAVTQRPPHFISGWHFILSVIESAVLLICAAFCIHTIYGIEARYIHCDSAAIEAPPCDIPLFRCYSREAQTVFLLSLEKWTPVESPLGFSLFLGLFAMLRPVQ